MLLVVAVAGLLCGTARGMQGVRMAECKLENQLKGTVKLHFTDKSESATMLMGSIAGLTPGKHGFHVHQVEGREGEQVEGKGKAVMELWR
jgi:Cu/Zn superoxide dismutase